MRRAILILAGFAVAFAIGFLVSRITIPEALSEAVAPPEASPITVEVENRVIRQTLVGRATVDFEGEWSPSVSDLSGLDGAAPKFTWLPDPGAILAAGDVVAAISYRPVILLPGVQPLVRETRRGDSGLDIRQLQESLAELGHLDPNGIDGEYGRATEQAVELLYESVGHEPLKRNGLIVASPSELLVTEGLPLRLREVAATVGDLVSPGLLPMTFSIGPPLLVAGLPGFETSTLVGGEPVEILDETTGETVNGTVLRIGNLPDQEIGGVPVTIDPDVDLPDDRVYRVTMILESTGSAALAVPEPAIFLNSDGASYVTRVEGNRRVHVLIDVGLVGSDGWAQVIPKAGESLTAGSQVLIGEG
jgi:peptidoglycan hydrolase-like protein with peptidoglycan-binding domain